MKVWILTNRPSPHQIEFFRAIHQSGQCEIAARFMGTSYRDEPPISETEPGFPYRILPTWGVRFRRDEFCFHPKALAEIRSRSADMYILSGIYTSLTFLGCAALLHMSKQPWAVWFERPWPENYRPSWVANLSARSTLAARIRKWLLKRIFSGADGIFCIGTSAVAAYRAMGAQEHKLHLLPYFCDTARFTAADRVRAQELRKQLGFNGKMVFLSSGALIPRKGADVLIAAFQRLAAERQDIGLLLLGDGAERLTLERSIRPELKDRVVFAGHRAQDELPLYFASADVFVFPSRHDGWALVVNEALGAGLPVIATRETGAAIDLVKEGQNGFLLERDDEAGFYEKMKFFAEDRSHVERFSQSATRLIADFSLERGVHMFCEAVKGSLQQ